LVKYWIISEPLVIKYDLSFITREIQLSTNFLTVILVNVYLFSLGPYFGKNGPSYSDQVGPGPSTFKFLAGLCMFSLHVSQIFLADILYRKQKE
jgi:hypothetical protein